ncbi:hypothetical protein SS50377_21962 [Spironucleus salmonicida]|nr:hypothetical protein SS50377_21962 [Spironucleus salmonicida]
MREKDNYEYESTKLTIMLQVSEQQMKEYREEILTLGNQIKKLNIGLKQQSISKVGNQVFKADSYAMSQTQIKYINQTLNKAQNQENHLPPSSAQQKEIINIDEVVKTEVEVLQEKVKKLEKVVNIKKINQSTSMRSHLAKQKKDENQESEDYDENFEEEYSDNQCQIPGSIKKNKQVRQLQQIVYELTDKEVQDISKDYNIDVSKQLQLLSNEQDEESSKSKQSIAKNSTKMRAKQKLKFESGAKNKNNSLSESTDGNTGRQMPKMKHQSTQTKIIDVNSPDKQNPIKLLQRFQTNMTQGSSISLTTRDSVGMVVKQVPNNEIRNSNFQQSRLKTQFFDQNTIPGSQNSSSQLLFDQQNGQNGYISATDNYDPKGKFKVFSLNENQTRASPNQRSQPAESDQHEYKQMFSHGVIQNKLIKEKRNNKNSNVSEDGRTDYDDQVDQMLIEKDIDYVKHLFNVNGLSSEMSFNVNDYLDDLGNLCDSDGRIKYSKIQIDTLKKQVLMNHMEQQYIQQIDAIHIKINSDKSSHISKTLPVFDQQHANSLFTNGKKPVYTNTKTEKIVYVHTCLCREYQSLQEKYQVIADKNKFLEKVITQLSKQTNNDYKLKTNEHLQCKSSIVDSSQVSQQAKRDQQVLQTKHMLPSVPQQNKRSESPILKPQEQPLFHSGQMVEKIIYTKSKTQNSQLRAEILSSLPETLRYQDIQRQTSVNSQQLETGNKQSQKKSTTLHHPQSTSIQNAQKPGLRNSFIESTQIDLLENEKVIQTLLDLTHYIPTPETALIGFQTSDLVTNQTRNCFSPCKGQPWQGRSASVQINERLNEFQARSIINAERIAYNDVAVRLRKQNQK